MAAIHAHRRALAPASPAPFSDAAYTGAVAVAGSYALFSNPETNKSAGWYSYKNATYPATITGSGMANSDPSTGANAAPSAFFEIHFNGTGIALYGYTNGPYGISRGSLDGVAIAGNIVYGVNSGIMAIVYQVSGLTSGRHVLKHFGDPTLSSAALIPQYYIIS